MNDFISIEKLKEIATDCVNKLDKYHTKPNIETKYEYKVVIQHKGNCITLDKYGCVRYYNDYCNRYTDHDNFSESIEKVYDFLKDKMITHSGLDKNSSDGYLNNGNLVESQINMLIQENEKLKQRLDDLENKFNF